MPLLEKCFDLITDYNSHGSCYICFSNFDEDSLKKMYRTPCYHAFHYSCISKWKDINEEKEKSSVKSIQTQDDIIRGLKDIESQRNSLIQIIDKDNVEIEKINRLIQEVQATIEKNIENYWADAEEGSSKKLNKTIKMYNEKKKSTESHLKTIQNRLSLIEISF